MAVSLKQFSAHQNSFSLKNSSNCFVSLLTKQDTKNIVQATVDVAVQEIAFLLKNRSYKTATRSLKRQIKNLNDVYKNHSQDVDSRLLAFIAGNAKIQAEPHFSSLAASALNFGLRGQEVGVFNEMGQLTFSKRAP